MSSIVPFNLIIPVCLAIIKRFKVSCKDGMQKKPLFTTWVQLGYKYFLEIRTRAVMARDTRAKIFRCFKLEREKSSKNVEKSAITESCQETALISIWPSIPRQAL
jgi:hypothetical protein